MDSLGEKLRTAREAKGYSFEEVSRDTNIAARYLAALEAEDFSGFPGEPYIFGFLRNYGDYLGLDVQELLSLYRSLKIQEQPVPVEQLLKSPSPLPKIIAIVAAALVVLAAAAGAVYFFLHFPGKSPPPEAGRASAEYVMSGDSLERRFYRGDSILVSVDAVQYKLELAGLGEAVTVATPSGNVILDLSQEVDVDLNNDGITDLRITAADFVKNDAAQGVLLRLETNSFPAVMETAVPPVSGAVQGAAETGAAGLGSAVVIFSSPSAYPFTLQSVFQGYCMFRWEILFERDRRDRNEQYFQRADELNIQAQNGVRIWVSNAQAAKLQIIGGGRTVPVELGGAGEVVVADIRWVRDDENRYRLVLLRLETGNSR
ncbi:MAG: helix-turn-helix domain-containing protein [Treponema sp.]|nr:helix-turn-helix domain-containing protein [Treponema sp.]